MRRCLVLCEVTDAAGTDDIDVYKWDTSVTLQMRFQPERLRNPKNWQKLTETKETRMLETHWHVRNPGNWPIEQNFQKTFKTLSLSLYDSFGCKKHRLLMAHGFVSMSHMFISKSDLSSYQFSWTNRTLKWTCDSWERCKQSKYYCN